MLRAMFPAHPVWRHRVFQDAAYQPFAREMEAYLREEEAPNQLSILYQAMPLVTEYLKIMDARNEQRTSELKASVGRMITAAQTAQSSHLQQLLTSGRLTLRLEAP